MPRQIPKLSDKDLGCTVAVAFAEVSLEFEEPADVNLANTLAVADTSNFDKLSVT